MASGDDPVSKVTTGMIRKLAAILSADVVAYSRLMGEDEEATIRTLTTYREVMVTLIQQYRGRVVDFPGDNLLAEFASVVDAVQCAVAIQRELKARNMELPPHRWMQFRLGINLGDVIVEGEQIYGDGVNIAARLEGLADPGGLCISGTVYDQIENKLALGYTFLGEHTVKNITKPVRVYRVKMEPGAAVPLSGIPHGITVPMGWRGALVVLGLLLVLGGGVTIWQRAWRPLSPAGVVLSKPAPVPALHDKPSIAVLPFVNISEDQTQEYFSDGMTEDLITDLAKLGALFVIARNSVFTYKGKTVRPEQISRELGVRYLIEGSVRLANNRVRITAQLVDTTTGYHLWAERYDRDLQDIFVVQEEIARRITTALAVKLTPEEAKHMGQKDTDNPEALKLFMRGRELARRYTKEENAQARELFEQAIGLDPQFARAYANLSATHRFDWNYGWSENAQASEQKAFDLAQESVQRNPELPYGYQQLAYLYVYRGQHEQAIAAAQEAVRLGGSSYTDGAAALAQMLIYGGQPAQAIPLMQAALRVDPQGQAPAYYFYHLGQAYYVMGQYEMAEQNLQEALRISPKFRPARNYLVAVYIEVGREKEAREEMATLLGMGRPQSVQNVRRVAPYKDATIRDRLLEAWRRAGG
jgi:TolB-like protein/class 3 adenylate cyclase/cytochrome c-type biogenesis protein CcmH/NrfG